MRRALPIVVVLAACGGAPDLGPCAAADGGLVGSAAVRPLVLVGDRVSDRVELFGAAAGAPLARVGCMSVDEDPAFVDEPFDLAIVGDRVLAVLGHADGYARGTLVARRIADGAKLAELSLGEEPSMIAVSADGKRAYVTLFRNLAHPRGPWTDAGALVAVDLERMAVTATVDTCAAALGVALDEARGRAWVACLGGDAVDLVDTATMTVTRTVPLGPGVGPAYVVTDGAHAFVTAQVSGELLVLDGESGDVATRIALGSGSFPQRLALVPGQPLALVAVDGAEELGVVATDALLLVGRVPLASPGRLVALDVAGVAAARATVVGTAPTAVFPQAVRVLE